MRHVASSRDTCCCNVSNADAAGAVAISYTPFDSTADSYLLRQFTRVRPIGEAGIALHFFKIIRKPMTPTIMISVNMGTKQHDTVGKGPKSIGLANEGCIHAPY